MRGRGSTRKARFSYANIAATLALVMSMGGTAYAAATIGSPQVIDNSLKGIDIKNGSLTGADLARNAVTSSRIKNGSIRMIDLGSDARAVVVTEIDLSIAAPLSPGVASVTLIDSGGLAVEAACIQPFDIPFYASVSFPRPSGSSTLLATDGSVWLPSYQLEGSDHSTAAVFLTTETISYVFATEAGGRELQVHLKLTASGSSCEFSGVITELRG